MSLEGYLSVPCQVPVSVGRERKSVEAPADVWGGVPGSNALERHRRSGLQRLLDELVHQLRLSG